MAHNKIFNPRFLVLLPLVAVLLIGLACGGAEDTTTTEPTATPAPTPTPVDVAAIASGLQEVIKGSVEEALKEQAGAADEPISPEDLQKLVESAVEASVPPGTSPIEIQRMVQEAVEASAQPGLSREEVADLVAQAVAESAGESLTAEEVQGIIAMAVATPTPLPVAAATLEWEPPSFISSGKYGGIMPMSALTWAVNWDPHQQSGLLDSSISSGFYNQLMRWDYQDRDKLMGDLVKTWELTDDGGYLFKLYEGAIFLDGESVNADDVKFSLDRMIEEGRPRPKAPKLARYYNGSEVIDDNTIKMNLKIPRSPAFLQYLTVENYKIIGKHIGDNFDLATDEGKAALEEFLDDTDNINGSGPYMFKDFQDEVSVEWEKNPNYWKDGMPFLDGIRMFLIADNTRLIAAFKGEQVLMPHFGDTGMGVRDLESAKGEWGNQIRIHWIGGTNLDTFVVNFQIPPFDDPRVRSALYIGMDRLQHINTLLSGRGKMGTPFFIDTWMTPSDEEVGTWPGFRYVDKHTGEQVLIPYGRDDVVKDPRDIEKAKALLAEAGYTEDNPLKIEYKAFNLAYHSSVAQLGREMFKAIGVDTEIKLQDIPTNFGDTKSGNYQIFHITRATDILDSDELLLGNYLPKGVALWDTPDIPEMHEAFAMSSTEPDQAKRQAVIREAGEFLRRGEHMNQLGIAWIDRYALPVNLKVQNFRVGRTLGENYMHESIWLEDPSEFN